jgi:hypothetical protein
MPELLGLVELKKRAKAAGYTKISRLGDAGSAVPLDSWDGVTVDAESGDGTSQRILRGAGYRQMEISAAFEVCPHREFVQELLSGNCARR